MFADGLSPDKRQVRRDLLQRYVRLQRDLIDADPSSAAYQSTVHAFRQLGYALLTNGFEDDLDRLLRLRVLEGGRSRHRPEEHRAVPAELHVMERRLL